MVVVKRAEEKIENKSMQLCDIPDGFFWGSLVDADSQPGFSLKTGLFSVTHYGCNKILYSFDIERTWTDATIRIYSYEPVNVLLTVYKGAIPA